MFKDNPKLKSIFSCGFLLSFHVALTAYVNSSFLSTFLAERNVGWMYVVGSLSSIAALLLIPKLLRKIGGYKFLLLSVGLNAICLLSLSIFKSASVILPIFLIYYVLNIVIVFSLDELLEIFSKNSKVGRVRGLYLAIMSSAWVIAQIVSAKVLHNFSFGLLYFISFEIMTVLLVVSYFYLKGLPDPEYDRSPIWPGIKKFFRKGALKRAYAMNFIMQFFYAFMVIYTPIYLHSYLLFSWAEIGTMFTIMLTPFVFMPFPLGKYSDKIGERKILIYGFALAALATFFLFFIKVHVVWVWTLMLFMTRLGVASVEIMCDVYFFKHITPEDDEFIGIYRNTSPVAFVLAPMVAFLILSFAPAFNFIFLVLGIMLILGVYVATTIRPSDI